MKCRIVPPQHARDGRLCSGLGTRVEVEDESGQWIPLQHVSKALVTYAPDEIVTATVSLHVTTETIDAELVLSEETLREAARLRGLALVPIDSV